jgi:hypothetical protein
MAPYSIGVKHSKLCMYGVQYLGCVAGGWADCSSTKITLLNISLGNSGHWGTCILACSRGMMQQCSAGGVVSGWFLYRAVYGSRPVSLLVHFHAVYCTKRCCCSCLQGQPVPLSATAVLPQRSYRRPSWHGPHSSGTSEEERAQ